MFVAEVWREEQEVDAHNARAGSSLFFSALAAFGTLLSLSRRLFPRSSGRQTQKRFLPFPPSPGWPFGTSERENSEREAEGRPNIVCVLCRRRRLRAVRGEWSGSTRGEAGKCTPLNPPTFLRFLLLPPARTPHPLERKTAALLARVTPSGLVRRCVCGGNCCQGRRTRQMKASG